MIEQTLFNIKKFCKKGQRLAVGCSGGMDSMLLAHIASKVRGIDIVLVHVNHNIRSLEETRNDISLVQDYANKIGADFRLASLKLPLDGNIENNARIARYAAFKELCSDCVAVATAHHADDHLVTVLMHIARGCGAKGLKGIRETSSINGLTVVRPMLHATKDEISRIVSTRDIPYLEDSTNQDHLIVRNSFNKEVLPLIKKFYPKASQHAVSMSSKL
jgi:tRNA(Ile)-lysidine synthase